ncbi:hypothetical protein OBBRIDRAFT_67813 [Obba rivulosa]|uniref:Uncharacterized protein n=1 Tax=Obba rivulosa TaxID=1052685 RepID=A0A8E2AUT5_9APHY|nr:hypothetical protein OBBRIDRAFT_67813 [Obba rivulosa]
MAKHSIDNWPCKGLGALQSQVSVLEWKFRFDIGWFGIAPRGRSGCAGSNCRHLLYTPDGSLHSPHNRPGIPMHAVLITGVGQLGARKGGQCMVYGKTTPVIMPTRCERSSENPHDAIGRRNMRCCATRQLYCSRGVICSCLVFASSHSLSGGTYSTPNIEVVIRFLLASLICVNSMRLRAIASLYASDALWILFGSRPFKLRFSAAVIELAPLSLSDRLVCETPISAQALLSTSRSAQPPIEDKQTLSRRDREAYMRLCMIHADRE